MINVFNRFVLLLCALVLTGAMSVVANAKDIEIKPYIAKYKLYRSGKEHGTATRELFALNSLYRLHYESSIQWMIFSDERFETSEFRVENNQVKPLKYNMQRKGTGPDRSYEVTFDRENKKIIGPKKRRKRRKGTVPGATKWNDGWLDPISYQQQLYLDLRLGKKDFHYAFINRKGLEHEYIFKVTGEETLMLPYGSVKAIKVERIYENSERQTIAWFAPVLDYALVRIWKGKSGVEQFDLQLNELVR
jgi:hypothetical protein